MVYLDICLILILCSDLFKKALEPVGKALLDSKFGKSDIDDVVLVGGSTRIPKIQKMLTNFFDGKKLSNSINPDEAVAYGAAAFAAVLSGVRFNSIGQLVLHDVIPLSLGIAIEIDDIMSTVIPRNTPIPTKVTKTFTTSEDNQKTVEVKVFEGERACALDNHKLGQFTLSGMKPVPRRQSDIGITFEIDKNGILTVFAIDRKNSSSNSIVIKNENGRLSKDEIDHMIDEAKRFELEDKLISERSLARNELEKYLFEIKDKLKVIRHCGDSSIVRSAESLLKTVKNTITWLDGNTNLKKEAIDSQLKFIKTSFEPLMILFNSTQVN